MVPDKGAYRPRLVSDGANGVGAVSMKEFVTRLSGILETEIANTGERGELNSGCGADYVKTKQSALLGMTPGPLVRHVFVDSGFFELDKIMRQGVKTRILWLIMYCIWFIHYYCFSLRSTYHINK